MSRINLGKYIDGQPFRIDIDRLIETRLLVQASSGGGKSYLLRKLIEEIYGKVQIIVLDIEGEFSTIREKFDFIVAGKGGDISADPRYAEQLARKILELRTDLICDLYELKQPARIRFVKLFLDSMVNAPKDLWHPVIIILDEAHLFAPEKGKAESLSAVTDMMSRGRKRGFCLIPATQRPAKINKDVTAEAQNKLIGLANQEIDRKRGAEELGFSDKETVLTLRDLDPGQFYAVGPAFSSRGANLVKIDQVATKHPKSGTGRLKVHAPAPTAKVKAQLEKLIDLPREAEEELRDRASLQARIKELEREIACADVSRPTIDPAAINKLVLADRKILISEFQKCIRKLNYDLPNVIFPVIDGVMNSFTADEKMISRVELKSNIPRVESPSPHRVLSKPAKLNIEGRTFGACERKILGFLSMKAGQYFTKIQVGAMTGYSHGSGGFNNALSNLTRAALVIRNGGSIAINPESDVSELVDSTLHRLEDWVEKLGACERAIYATLLESPERVFSKEEVAETTGYSAGSGGFNNALSRLNTLGLIKRQPGSMLRINSDISSIMGGS